MPQGVISAHGRLYVSDHSGRRLQTFTARGEPLQHVNFVRREAPDQIVLGRLEGLCVSRAEDKLYVVDVDLHKLHVLSVRNNTHTPRYVRVVPGAPAPPELGYVEVAGGRADMVANGFPVPGEEVRPARAAKPAKAAGGKRAGGKARGAEEGGGATPAVLAKRAAKQAARQRAIAAMAANRTAEARAAAEARRNETARQRQAERAQARAQAVAERAQERQRARGRAARA